MLDSLREPCFALTLAISVACSRAAAAQTVPATDVQQWMQISVASELRPGLDITGFGEARVGDDVTALDEELLSAGVVYTPRQWVSLATGYLFVHADPTLSGINHENRIYGESTFRMPAFHGVLLSDRVRPELRWLELPAGRLFAQRYRNRVIVERPLTIAKTRISPFVMWENFYDTIVHDWSRRRAYAGVTLPVAHGTTMQVYFMHQEDDYSRPFRKNAVGVSLMRGLNRAHAEHPHE